MKFFFSLWVGLGWVGLGGGVGFGCWECWVGLGGGGGVVWCGLGGGGGVFYFVDTVLFVGRWVAMVLTSSSCNLGIDNFDSRQVPNLHLVHSMNKVFSSSFLT